VDVDYVESKCFLAFVSCLFAPFLSPPPLFLLTKGNILLNDHIFNKFLGLLLLSLPLFSSSLSPSIFIYRCCKPEKKLAEYTKCEKLCPIIAYMSVGIIAGICSILGLLYLLQVANAVTGLVCDVEDFRIDTSDFLDNITNPLSNISTLTATTVASISKKVGNASYVNNQFNNTLTSLNNASHYLLEHSPVNNIHWNDDISNHHLLPCNCTFCEYTSAGLTSIKNTMATNIGSTLTDL
jgi:hypothetical protein